LWKTMLLPVDRDRLDLEQAFVAWSSLWEVER
jgi:hypothetical protein